MASIIQTLNKILGACGKENKIKDKRKSLKKVMDFLSKIPNINRGGCGISALVLYDAAVAEGLNPKVVFCYHGKTDQSYINNRRFMADNTGNSSYATSCAHAVIKIGDKRFDCDGEYTKKELREKWHNPFFYSGWLEDDKITREHLVASINNVSSWNYSFERERYLKKIESFIGYDLGVKVER